MNSIKLERYNSGFAFKTKMAEIESRLVGMPYFQIYRQAVEKFALNFRLT